MSGTSGEQKTELTAATQRGVDAALTHAEDLLAGARLVAPYPNLAFHLAVLSLEEVGRSTLIVMQEIAARDDEGGRLRRETEDHVRKLFWAFWGPSFGREVITGPQIEEFRHLAQEIHDKRLRGLYVDPAGAPPREAISAGDADGMIRLAEARLGMARTSSWGPLDEDRAALVRWFMDATSDPQTRRQIVSNGSMRKLVELGSVPQWVSWLRSEIEAAQRQSVELAEKELAREAPGESEELEPKWRFKMRLQSGSHSVRPRPLSWWNSLSALIRLHPVTTDRQQLIVEFILPKRIPAAAVWYAGLGVANRTVLALNIGTTGFFWWYMPEHISRYYEELADLEADAMVTVERTPALRLDWGHLALSQEELGRVALCFGALPHRDEPEKAAPFDHYLTGVAFLAKTDIFMQFEANAFEHFYLALRDATRIYGDWDGASAFLPIFDRVTGEHLHEEEDRAKFHGAADKVESGRQLELRVDLSDVAMMKVLTDSYLIRAFTRQARSSRAGGQALANDDR